MTISALADETVRQLGSPTAITTAVDLVKELLENAIDADATSVEIRVSPNTVDRIDVRDNGTGICQDDWNSLGRPAHTSKIASLEDLRNLGGNTLGFRGQALASANMLGKVNVITRTAEDSTAMLLKLFFGTGGVESQQCASAPVGTTVSVRGLFNCLPVREQITIKEASKNIARIKQLLFTYALARPQLRLSFKILGEENRQSWTYSPRPQATVKEAVIQIFGAELMSRCLIHTACSNPDGKDDTPGHGKDKLAIEAVLPRLGSDYSKISKGSFFSVDSRPLSTERGTMKKLLAVFTSHFSNSMDRAHVHKPLRNPFICVNIKCSSGSYDANIEPSKNEALFANESELIDLFGCLCSDVYQEEVSLDPLMTIGKRELCRTQTRTPPPSSDRPEEPEYISLPRIGERQSEASGPGQMPLQSSYSPMRQQTKGNLPSSNAPDDTSLPRAHAIPIRYDHSSQSPVIPMSGQKKVTGYKISEFGDKQEDLLATPQDAMRAQAYALVLRHRPAARPQTQERRSIVNMLADPNDISSDDEAEIIAARLREQQGGSLLTGEGGLDSNEGLNPWTIAQMTASVRQPVDQSALAVGASQASDPVQQTKTTCMSREILEGDLPILRPYGGLPGDLDHHRTALLGVRPKDHLEHPLSGFSHPSPVGPAANSRLPFDDTPQTFPAYLHAGTLPDLRSNSNDAVKGMDRDKPLPKRLAPGAPRASQKRKNQKQLKTDDIFTRSNPPYREPRRANAEKGNLTAMDREKIDKYVVSQVDNDDLTGDGLGERQSLRQTPHSPGHVLNMVQTHIAERAATSQPGPSQENKNWSDGDTRTHLMRRQRSEADHGRAGDQPRKRIKTDTLPFETVPRKQEIQHLVLTIKPDLKDLTKGAFSRTAADDRFDTGSRMQTRLGDNMNSEDVNDIETRLKRILSGWTKKVMGKETEIELCLRSWVKGKSVAR